MAKLIVREATLEDALSLSHNLRPADLEELKASYQPDPLIRLTSGINYSRAPMTATNVDGLPVAMFGVIDHGDAIHGLPWLLASPEIEKHKVDFLRKSREYVISFQKKYPVLATIVYEKNALHRKWLQWCGFKEDDPVLINNNRFIRYIRLSDV